MGQETRFLTRCYDDFFIGDAAPEYNTPNEEVS